MLVLRLVSLPHIDAPLPTLIRVFNAHKYGCQRWRCDDGCECRFQITFVPFDIAMIRQYFDSTSDVEKKNTTDVKLSINTYVRLERNKWVYIAYV